MKYNSFKPGKVWLDTDGNRIQAHGGSILFVNDTFYWYGENKEKTLPKSTGRKIWHWGVRCYASKDLYNWTDMGLIVPPNLEDETSSLHPRQCMDRPHIIYNKKTKKYVCWLKIMEKNGGQTVTILTSENILGPYNLVKEGFRPLGMNAGDFDLVIDPTDEKAYYYFERVHSELICADLTEDYLDVTGYYSTHFPNIVPPYVREAPAYFTRKGLHYLFTSGTSGYHPNPSEVAVSKTYHGPFELQGNPHVNDTSRTSFNSQISSVFKHPLKKDLYIALADRWLPNFPKNVGDSYYTGEAYNKLEKMINWMADPDLEKPSVTKKEDLNIGETNTSIADYVWLPIRFEGDRAYLDWKEEWKIEDYE